MTDAKHTPGPWQVFGTRHTGDLKMGQDARLHFVGPDEDPVAAVFFDMKTGKGLLDARLIAAAPELLEALEQLVIEYDAVDLAENEPTSLTAAFNAALSAIAKAKGEAQ